MRIIERITAHGLYGIIWLLISISGSPAAGAAVDVRIEGVGDSLTEEIRTNLAIYRERDSVTLTDARVRILHRRAQDEIRQIMEAHGWYQATIETQLDRRDADWLATYRVTRNEPIRIRAASVRVTGATDPAFANLAADFPLQTGDVFDHGSYESGKSAMLRQALRRGYLDAAFPAHRVTVDVADYFAEIDLELALGQRYRYGEINFSGSALNPEILASLVPFESGQPYQADGLLGLQRNLQDTDFFAVVEVVPGRGDPQSLDVPVDVNLSMNRRNQYRAGVGFGTDSGPRLRLDWNNRYLNRRGHRTSAQLTGSLLANEFVTRYTIPFFRRPDAQLSVAASVKRESTDAFVSNQARIGVQHQRPRWGWDETLSLNYLFENFSIGADDRNGQLLIPSVVWARSKGDSVYPRDGHRLSVGLQGAHDVLFSDSSFFQVTVRGKKITSIGARGRFIARAELGAMVTSDFAELPTTLRYYAGGDSSIRGFDFDAIGPRDEQGDVVGGHYLAVGSLEYEHRIHGNWGAAVFVDFGNAFDDQRSGLAYGAGVGLRWLSPVGMVRFDVAHGDYNAQGGIRVHLILGPEL